MNSYEKKVHKLRLSLLVLTLVCLCSSQTVFCQTEKLGIVQYTPPKGWTKTANGNVVAFSQINRATGIFCIITLHGATPGTGNPQSDFKREWNNLVVKPLNAEANPKTATEATDGWTAIAGGTAIEFQGRKAAVLLTVISGGKRTVSV